MTVDRRTVIKGALAAGVATQVLKSSCRAGAGRPHPRRISDDQDRAARLRRDADGTGPHRLLQGAQQHAGGPAGELHTADTAGNPAQARTKTQELVERLNVAVLIGPLAAFEALAIDDYIWSSRTPILSSPAPKT